MTTKLLALADAIDRFVPRGFTDELRRHVAYRFAGRRECCSKDWSTSASLVAQKSIVSVTLIQLPSGHMIAPPPTADDLRLLRQFDPQGFWTGTMS